jgi:hypothetical protein
MAGGRHTVRATGRAGLLTIGGYTTAAVLGPWALVPAPAGGAWRVSSTIVRVALPRGLWARDLCFQAPELTGAAVWRVRSFTVTGTAIGADLDPPVK